MELNLAVLAEDLESYAFHDGVSRNRGKCQLRFGGIPEGSGVLGTSIAYVMTAQELNAMPPNRLRARPSIICIGKPSDVYLASDYRNVLWTEQDVTVGQLLNDINRRFDRYNQWIVSLEQATARCAPTKALGELSLEVLRRPIWVWDCHYQTVFSCTECSHFDLPEGYVTHDDHTPWPIWEINAWKDGGYIDIEATQKKREPYILPSTELFSYRALAYNVFFEDKWAATVTLDEVGKPLSERDYVLIERFGGVLGQALKRSGFFNASATQHTLSLLEKLLAGENIPDSHLASALNPTGWSDTGPFVCAVVQSATPFYPYETTLTVAEKTCSTLKGVMFAMDGDSIVFIINARRIDTTPLDVASQIFRTIGTLKYQMTMGVSTEFLKLRDLPSYRDQAISAIEVGRAKRYKNQDTNKSNGNECYYFEDYILDFIVDKCSTRVLPETLCPPGLKELIEYDRANGSELCITLRELIDNNMQVTETARKLFMHRNSLMKRLEKIKHVMQTDLEDPNNRLAIAFAFRILENRCDVLNPISHSPQERSNQESPL